MKYGGSNDIIGHQCPRCGTSPDNHEIQFIASDVPTEELILRLRNKLATVSLEGIENGYPTIRYAVMMAAAQATIGNQVRQYISLSGEAALLLAQIESLGQGVTHVTERNTSQLPAYYIWNGQRTYITDGDVVTPAGSCETTVVPVPASGRVIYRLERNIGGKTVAVIANDQNHDSDYLVGNCAGQKLVATVLRDADAAGHKVNKLNMCEMYWKDFRNAGGSRVWATGSLVESCDTCKQVIPQMLCDQDPSTAYTDKVRKQEAEV